MTTPSSIDVGTLKWVRKELDASLKRARDALEAHVRDGADSPAEALTPCVTSLHEVQGVLGMLELQHAANLAREMESVAVALANKKIAQSETAFETLMRAILQLPSYLDRLASGQPDVPVALEPLINELRSVRGVGAVAVQSSETSSTRFPAHSRQANMPASSVVAQKARGPYQAALLKILRNDDTRAQLSVMRKVVTALERSSASNDAFGFWWVLTGVIEDLESGASNLDQQAKKRLGQVDREIKRLAQTSEESWADAYPEELLSELKSLVLVSGGKGEIVSSIKDHFESQTEDFDADDVTSAQESLSGVNNQLLETVAAAVREDLASVKDGLDLFKRSTDQDVGGLSRLLDPLRKVSDTLAMLGLDVPRAIVQEKYAVIRGIIDGKIHPTDRGVMELASALLYVESSLSAMAADDESGTLGDEVLRNLQKVKSGDTDDSGPEYEPMEAALPTSEYRQIVNAVIQESATDLSKAKDAIVAFLENQDDRAPLQEVPELFMHVRGGLQMLEMEQAALCLEATAFYINSELMVGQKTMEEAEVDALADAISAIEYFMEALGDNRRDKASILKVAEQSLATLGVSLDDPSKFKAPVARFEEPAAQVAEDISDDDDGLSLPDIDSAVAATAATAAALSAGALAGSLDDNPQDDSPLEAEPPETPFVSGPEELDELELPQLESGEGTPFDDSVLTPPKKPADPMPVGASEPMTGIVSETTVVQDDSAIDPPDVSAIDLPESIALDEIDLPDVSELESEPLPVAADVSGFDLGSALDELETEQMQDGADAVESSDQAEIDGLQAELAAMVEQIETDSQPSDESDYEISATDLDSVTFPEESVSSSFATIGSEQSEVSGATSVNDPGEMSTVDADLLEVQEGDVVTELSVDASEGSESFQVFDTSETDDLANGGLSSLVDEDEIADLGVDGSDAEAPSEPEMLGGDTSETDSVPDALDTPSFETVELASAEERTPVANEPILDEPDASKLDLPEEGLIEVPDFTPPEEAADEIELSASGLEEITETVEFDGDVVFSVDGDGDESGLDKSDVIELELPEEGLVEATKSIQSLDAEEIVLSEPEPDESETVAFDTEVPLSIEGDGLSVDEPGAIELDPPAEDVVEVTESVQSLDAEEIELSASGFEGTETVDFDDGIQLADDGNDSDDSESSSGVLSEQTLSFSEDDTLDVPTFDLSDHLTADSVIADHVDNGEPLPGLGVDHSDDEPESAFDSEIAIEDSSESEASEISSGETSVSDIAGDLDFGAAENLLFEDTGDRLSPELDTVDLATREESLSEPGSSDINVSPGVAIDDASTPANGVGEPVDELTEAGSTDLSADVIELTDEPDPHMLLDEPETVDTEATGSDEPVSLADGGEISAEFSATNGEDLDLLPEDIHSAGQELQSIMGREPTLDDISALSSGDHLDSVGSSEVVAPEVDDDSFDFADEFDEIPGLQGDGLAAISSWLDEAEPKSEQESADVLAEAITDEDLPDYIREPVAKDADQEILEIFIEEANEELESVRHLLPNWKSDPGDANSLSSIRRSFHTLKGSGRLAGARLMGEYAWSVEHMLNMLIEDQISADNNVFKVLDDAADLAVPHLIGQLTGDKTGPVDIQTLMSQAEAASRGEAISVVPSVPIPVDDIEEESVAIEQVEEGTAELRMDPVLYDIFSKETAGYVEAVRDFADQALIRGDTRINENLMRALHTLQGSAHMAGVVEIADLSGALDGYVKGLHKNGEKLEREDLDLLVEASDVIDAIQSDLNTPGAKLPDIGPNLEQIAVRFNQRLPETSDVRRPVLADAAAILASTPAHRAETNVPKREEPITQVPDAPVSTPAVETKPRESEQPSAASEEAFFASDPELLEIFLQEGEEILDAAEVSLEHWRKRRDERSVVAELQRGLHTLKGGARMAGIPPIAELSHALETMFSSVVDDSVSASDKTLDTIQASFDRLVQMLEQIREGHQPKASGDLIELLEHARKGVDLPGPTGIEPVFDQADDSVEVPEALELALPEQTKPVVQSVAEAEQSGAPAALEPQNLRSDAVRVDVDLLGGLVNLAGEVSIYRSRLEQKLGSFQFNLNELDQTVSRLKDQLRHLEIETEAQILSRFDRESDEKAADFDPLEFDRFSQLQTLSRGLMESITDVLNLKNQLDEETRETETLLVQQARVNTNLQEGLMRTRMVPFSGVVPRLRRILRQTARELDKRADLTVSGGEGELDRSVLERITAPLEHMVRNAIYHGIESPDVREGAGKAAAGILSISLSRRGPEMIIRVSDDGSGLDMQAVRAKAIERGLIDASMDISDHDLQQIITEPGFTTASKVSQISGRGVGMDVVYSELKQLGGSLEIDSREGAGTAFTLYLPFTLAVNRALLARVADEVYAVPLAALDGVVRLGRQDLERVYSAETPLYQYGGETYLVQYLGAMVGSNLPDLPDKGETLPVLLMRAGDQRVALQVDALMGSREIVVKSLGPQLAKVPGIAGATILGDGRVVLILEIATLLRRESSPQYQRLRKIAEQRRNQHDTGPIKVMVVDDSITMRKVATRLLERQGMEVTTAKDGVDALAHLHEVIPDVMLLDIEMPRMDGYELAGRMRRDPRFESVPIIMITSRTGTKHRDRANELGVNRYLGKPYQEAELLHHIRELSNRAGEDA